MNADAERGLRGPLAYAIHASFFVLLSTSGVRYVTVHGTSGRFGVVLVLAVVLALLYAVLGRWQGETGRSIDLVLQVGDLGAFPDARVDRATNRHAARDHEERGFMESSWWSGPKARRRPSGCDRRGWLRQPGIPGGTGGYQGEAESGESDSPELLG